MRKRLAIVLCAVLLALSVEAPAAFAAGYRDVPAQSALKEEVEKAGRYGLMNGYSAELFGYGDAVTRAQFATVLSRMMGWTEPEEQTLPAARELPETLSATYRTAISRALAHDVVDSDEPFRPGAAITRGEMSEMLVRALGLKSAAAMTAQLWADRTSAYSAALPFTDVSGSRAGYILIAYQIGMTKGTSATTFAPNATATRAQAAAMLVRIYEKLHPAQRWNHGFYAISSHNQIGLSAQLNALSAGWSRMSWDGETALLATTSANGNEYAVPSGYDDAVRTIRANGAELNLSVFMDASGGVKELLASEQGREEAINQILQELTVSYRALGDNPYDGVTIDFEGLRSAQKADFNAFLESLSRQVHALGKSLYVCVSPVLSGSYYDGYDFKTIAGLADHVIVMAYDYDARDLSAYVGTEYYKTAAPSPVDQVYWGLETVCAKVGSPENVSLGVSFKAVAWKIDANGKLLSGTPVYPSTETVAQRLQQADTQLGWSDTYQMPYAVYTTQTGERYFLWYENGQSLQVKENLAALLGAEGVSLWRLGLIPEGAF